MSRWFVPALLCRKRDAQPSQIVKVLARLSLQIVNHDHELTSAVNAAAQRDLCGNRNGEGEPNSRDWRLIERQDSHGSWRSACCSWSSTGHFYHNLRTNRAERLYYFLTLTRCAAGEQSTGAGT